MGEEETVTEVVEAAANRTTTREEKGADGPETKEQEKNGVEEMEEDTKDDEKVGTKNMDLDAESEEYMETKEEEKNYFEKEEEEEKEENKENQDEEKKVPECKKTKKENNEEIRIEPMEEEMKEKQNGESEENKEIKEEDKNDIEKKESKETQEEEKKEEPECKTDEEEKNEETRIAPMEKEMKEKQNGESKEKVETADDLTKEEKKAEVSNQEKGSKRRGKGKTDGIKAKSSAKKVKEKEQKTPVASAIERPVRERKSVERLVASFEKDFVKELRIEKGRGTALKDIPNVAFKLSKRKTDDSIKLLHTVLFGRRGKAVDVKSNISRFSGFVWKENEEKQTIKVKEKLDKCVKEKLLEFCDVLDIPIAKANARKEDIVAKLIDFLLAPQATTTKLLAEKEQQSNTGKKRKRSGKQNASISGSTLSKHSAKSRRTTESVSKEREKNRTPEREEESDEEEKKEEEEEDQEEENGAPDRSINELPVHSESESEEDTGKYKRGSKKLSAKKVSSVKEKNKTDTTPKKSSPLAKRTPVKSSSTRSKVNDSSVTTPKTFSRKRRTEAVKEKSSIPKKPASLDKLGKKVVTGKDKTKENRSRPSDDDLRNAICEILKEVDFNTATFTDILKQLAKRYNTDLAPRKASIKLMIQDELTKLADEEEDEEDEGDTKKDKTRPPSQVVGA